MKAKSVLNNAFQLTAHYPMVSLTIVYLVPTSTTHSQTYRDIYLSNFAQNNHPWHLTRPEQYIHHDSGDDNWLIAMLEERRMTRDHPLLCSPSAFCPLTDLTMTSVNS